MSNEQKLTAFQILFKPSEFITIGNVTESSVYSYSSALSKSGNFFCINPLHGKLDFNWQNDKHKQRKLNRPRRDDLNVTAFRNFLFEMDSVPLDQQLEMISKLDIQPTLITFSGGKSYHMIYSLTEDLNLEPHKKESTEKYKKYWEALQAKLDACLVAAGYTLPENKNSFFDPACKNASRFSRTAGEMRDGVEQKLVNTGPLLKTDELPDPSPIRQFVSKPVASSKNGMKFLPIELKLLFDTPSMWAASEGLYPQLFRLLLWAIDSTGANKPELTAYLEKKTIPGLQKAGYPPEKVYKAIDDAYNMKSVG